MRPENRDGVRLLRHLRVVLAHDLARLALLDQPGDGAYWHASTANDRLPAHDRRVALDVAVAQANVLIGALDRLGHVLGDRDAKRLGQLELGPDGFRATIGQPRAQTALGRGARRRLSRQSRGSTGSLSIARTPNTHSCTR